MQNGNIFHAVEVSDQFSPIHASQNAISFFILKMQLLQECRDDKNVMGRGSSAQ